MRLMGLFSASSGAFIDGEIGSYCGKGQGETSLLKKILGSLTKKSILVLDKYFTSLLLQHEFLNAEVDYVIRARDKNAKKYLKAKSDIIVEIKACGKTNPKDIRIRYIKSSIKREGFRTVSIYILTNLFIEDGFSKKDIEELYLKRWGVELDIRHLKTTLEATLLRSKSPEQARKELWVHLLAFNLIRKLNNNCSYLNDIPPRKQGFKISIEAYLIQILDSKNIENIVYELLKMEILKSKYRREPRAIKRYNKRFELMNMDRKLARKLKWGKSGRNDRKGLLNKEAA